MDFTKQVEDLSIEEVLSAPRAPWQRAYIERVIGSIRRACLDQMIVFNEGALYRHVQSFMDYYHASRRTFRWRRTLRVVDRYNRQSLGE